MTTTETGSVLDLENSGLFRISGLGFRIPAVPSRFVESRE